MQSNPNNTSDFLAVEAAAQLVGISHWTVRSWLQKGMLTRYKSASRTVVSRAELLERLKPTPVIPGSFTRKHNQPAFVAGGQ